MSFFRGGIVVFIGSKRVNMRGLRVRGIGNCRYNF